MLLKYAIYRKEKLLPQIIIYNYSEGAIMQAGYSIAFMEPAISIPLSLK